MKSYYHWTSWQDVKAGTILGTTWEESEYWKNKRTMIGPELGLEVPDILKSIITKDVLNDIQKQKYQAEFDKELLFEEVREGSFPNLPSRKLCMFSIPTDIDPHEFGKRINLHVDKYQLIEIRPVEGQSIVHQSNMELLNCTGKSKEEMTEFATEYWVGNSIDTIDSEVLIYGNFEVLKIMELDKAN
jgi:hypothetical protein